MKSNLEFRYFRNHNEHGELLNIGGFTLVFRVDDNAIHYGYAICSEKDSYNKQIGKEVAIQRLAMDPVIIDAEVILDFFYESLSVTLPGLNKDFAIEVFQNMSLENINKNVFIDIGLEAIRELVDN